MSTKSESLAAVRPSVRASHQRVLDCLWMSMGKSRSEIARQTGLRLSSVCGRVNELIAMERVVVDGTQWDNETQRNVQTVRLA